jgi:hypothetical protein
LERGEERDGGEKKNAAACPAAGGKKKRVRVEGGRARNTNNSFPLPPDMEMPLRPGMAGYGALPGDSSLPPSTAHPLSPWTAGSGGPGSGGGGGKAEREIGWRYCGLPCCDFRAKDWKT